MEASPGEIAALITSGLGIVGSIAGAVWKFAVTPRDARIAALESLNDAKDKACAKEIADLHLAHSKRVDELHELRAIEKDKRIERAETYAENLTSAHTELEQLTAKALDLAERYQKAAPRGAQR